MSGFMSSSTAMTICKADTSRTLDLDALRKHALRPILTLTASASAG